MNNLLILFGSLISAAASHFLTPSILPSTSINETSSPSDNSQAAESKTEEATYRSLLAKVSTFNQKIIHNVAMNNQRSLEELMKQKEVLFNLYKETAFSSNAKIKENFSNYSNYLLKIIYEDLSGEVTCERSGEECRVNWNGVENLDTYEAKSLKAINLNKNVLSLAVHGEEIEKKLLRGWNWEKSIKKRKLKNLSREVDKFTWSFAKKIGSDWKKTIEVAEQHKSTISELSSKISSISDDANPKDKELVGKLRNYLVYLKKILKDDLTADRNGNEAIAEITRSIQENLLDMMNQWKKAKESLKNPHKVLFAETSTFGLKMVRSVAMNDQMALEEAAKQKNTFFDLYRDVEIANKKLKNKRIKKSLNSYSDYLLKIIYEDLSGKVDCKKGECEVSWGEIERPEDSDAKLIRAISLNKNILSLMVYGEKIEKNSSLGKDWRESIENEELRKLSMEIDKFTWSFARKVGSNWLLTLQEADKHKDRMAELESRIAEISKDKNSEKNTIKKLENYSNYLKKILEEDLPADRSENAMEITRVMQKNLLYMVNYWKEFKESVKK